MHLVLILFDFQYKNNGGFLTPVPSPALKDEKAKVSHVFVCLFIQNSWEIPTIHHIVPRETPHFAIFPGRRGDLLCVCTEFIMQL